MSKKRKKLSRDQKRKAKLANRADKQQELAARRREESAFQQEAASLIANLDPKVVRQRLEAMWSLEKIEPMTTAEIVGKLQSLGITFDEQEFMSGVGEFYSPHDLAEHLWRDAMDRIPGADADFPWMAGEVLWQRLCPDIPNTVTVNDALGFGFDMSDQGDVATACDVWLRVWSDIKNRLLTGLHDVDALDERLGEYYSIIDWLYLFSDDLRKAGKNNPAYLRERAAFCTEICELLPDSDAMFRRTMQLEAAGSLVLLGDFAAAEEKLNEMERTFPDWSWEVNSFRGDLWSGDFCKDHPFDLTKACAYYQKAAEQAPEEEEPFLQDRLEELSVSS